MAVGLFGWRPSFAVIALLQAVVTLLIFLKVQDRPFAGADRDAHPHESADKPGMLQAWGVIARDRSFWLLAAIAFCWYGNYLAVQGLWGGPFLMHLMGLTREGAGQMLMWTSVGFIIGSTLMDRIARHLFHSYSRTLLAGQVCLTLLMTGFLGWLAQLPGWALAFYFLGIGLTVSSGVMIYPIIRASVPLSMVGTGLTSLNFFVLLGAAMAQQGMGLIIGRYGGYTAEAFRAAFSLPVAGLLLTTLLFFFARNSPAGK
jgi:predicted MFS family arabinose efflux permease